jgi:hypothetical protein
VTHRLIDYPGRDRRQPGRSRRHLDGRAAPGPRRDCP